MEETLFVGRDLADNRQERMGHHMGSSAGDETIDFLSNIGLSKRDYMGKQSLFFGPLVEKSTMSYFLAITHFIGAVVGSQLLRARMEQFPNREEGCFKGDRSLQSNLVWCGQMLCLSSRVSVAK